MNNNLYPLDFFTLYGKSDFVDRMGCLEGRDAEACNYYCKEGPDMVT